MTTARSRRLPERELFSRYEAWREGWRAAPEFTVPLEDGGVVEVWNTGGTHEWTATVVTYGGRVLPLRIGPYDLCLREAARCTQTIGEGKLAEEAPTVRIRGMKRHFVAARAAPLLGVVPVEVDEAILLGVVDHAFYVVHVRGRHAKVLAHSSAALGHINADLERDRIRSSRVPGLQRVSKEVQREHYRLLHGSTAAPEPTHQARQLVRQGLQALARKIPVGIPHAKAAVAVAELLARLPTLTRLLNFRGNAPTILRAMKQIDASLEIDAQTLARGLAVLAQITCLVAKPTARTWEIQYEDLTNPASEHHRKFLREIGTFCLGVEVHVELAAGSPTPLATESAEPEPVATPSAAQGATSEPATDEPPSTPPMEASPSAVPTSAQAELCPREEAAPAPPPWSPAAGSRWTLGALAWLLERSGCLFREATGNDELWREVQGLGDVALRIADIVERQAPPLGEGPIAANETMFHGPRGPPEP